MLLFARSNLLHLLRERGLLLTALAVVALVSRCNSQPASTAHSSGHSASASSSNRKSSSGTTPQQQGNASKDAVEDAVIFVRPLSYEGANIGIAYGRKITHAAARADVSRLLRAGKWQLAGPVQITDDSLHPDRPVEFPLTTGVFFRAAHAPQVTDNAPNLLPYLNAFQRFHRFDLNFEIGTLMPYRGVTQVENNVVGIQMLRDEGLYSFQITFHDHKENIPALVNSGEAIDQSLVGNPAVTSSPDQQQMEAEQTTIGRKQVPRRPNMLLIVTLALGAGALVGGSIYLVMSRQSSR